MFHCNLPQPDFLNYPNFGTNFCFLWRFKISGFHSILSMQPFKYTTCILQVFLSGKLLSYTVMWHRSPIENNILCSLMKYSAQQRLFICSGDWSWVMIVWVIPAKQHQEVFVQKKKWQCGVSVPCLVGRTGKNDTEDVPRFRMPSNTDRQYFLQVTSAYSMENLETIGTRTASKGPLDSRLIRTSNAKPIPI